MYMHAYTFFLCLNMRPPTIRWNASMAFACDIVKFELWNEFVHVWLPFRVYGQLKMLEKNAKSVT